MHLYNDYNTYLRNKYGTKVYRIGLDAGFTCPNRDGTVATGGCIYCNEDGSRSPYVVRGAEISEQLRERIKHLRETKGAVKFIAYFQAFTNTHAPLPVLKKTYDHILPLKEIVGLSIGTRPDAVDKGKLELIASYKNGREVWVEYGLQSSHDRTLKAINRGHSFLDFKNALQLAKDCALLVSAHVILGLPGETRQEMIETAKRLTDLKIDGIKIHLLHILKGSPMEKLYNEGKVSLPGQDEYVELVCSFLEHLSPDIVIQRLTGQGNRENHIAPAWALDKSGTIGKIVGELKRRGSCQGGLIS